MFGKFCEHTKNYSVGARGMRGVQLSIATVEICLGICIGGHSSHVCISFLTDKSIAIHQRSSECDSWLINPSEVILKRTRNPKK